MSHAHKIFQKTFTTVHLKFQMIENFLGELGVEEKEVFTQMEHISEHLWHVFMHNVEWCVN